MKKRSKLLFIAFNVVLLVALAWAVIHLVYAPAGMSIELTSNMENVQPNEWVSLRFKILDESGQTVTDFERMHEKLLHLIVVREDLSEFQHLHPELNKETGEFSVDVQFDEAGPYHLFADFTPANSAQTVLSFPVTVVGDYQPDEVTLSGTEPFTVQGMTVTPHFPETLQTGVEVDYSFDVSLDGKAVALEDYLGAKGHSVILSQDELSYMHTHPKDDSLSFETLFDEPGVYKSFTQFQVDGRVTLIEYTFEVSGGSVQTEDSMEEMTHDSH